MFQSLSATEILTIAVVALIVVGPRHLPGIARRLGKYVSEIRRAAAGFREDLEREVAPLKQPLEDLKQVQKDLTKPVTEVRKSMDDTVAVAEQASQDVQKAGKDVQEASQGSPVDTPRARWIAPEPKTGVSPSEAWEGVNDPAPEPAGPRGALPPLPDLPTTASPDDPLATAPVEDEDPAGPVSPKDRS